LDLQAGMGAGLSAGSGAGASGWTGMDSSASSGVRGRSTFDTNAGSTGSATGSAGGGTSGVLRGILGASALTQAQLNAIARAGAGTPITIARPDTSAGLSTEGSPNANVGYGAEARLQAAIVANAQPRARLQAVGIAVTSIVDAGVGAEGGLTLYARR
jgi:hypothetical protein